MEFWRRLTLPEDAEEGELEAASGQACGSLSMNPFWGFGVVVVQDLLRQVLAGKYNLVS